MYTYRGMAIVVGYSRGWYIWQHSNGDYFLSNYGMEWTKEEHDIS
jgi:hypothetical protein